MKLLLLLVVGLLVVMLLTTVKSSLLQSLSLRSSSSRSLSSSLSLSSSSSLSSSNNINKDFKNELVPFHKIFKHLDDHQWTQLNELACKLYDWNSKVNLISRKDIDSLVLNHIIPSLSISLVKQFKDDETVIDIGTGGGLPGLPMAIACPNAKFTLLDSNGKKIAIVDDMIQSIGLKNVKTIRGRAEDVNQTFDYMMGRAVSAVPTFLGFSSHFVDGKSKVKPSKSPKGDIVIESGLLYLKGGDFGNELSDASISKYHLFPVKELVSIDSDKNVLYVPSDQIVAFHANKVKQALALKKTNKK